MEQVSLDVSTMLLFEKIELLIGFNAFGNNPKFQTMSQGDNCANNHFVILVSRKVPDKMLADLKSVNGKFFEIKREEKPVPKSSSAI